MKTFSRRLADFLGAAAVRALAEATSATRFEVVYSEPDADRELEGRLVRGARELTSRQVAELRDALLDDETYLWDFAMRHRDTPWVAFEITGPGGACAVFFDGPGRKIRVASEGSSRVRDCLGDSAGYQRLAALAEA